ncbi:large ribosomal subunit protein mL39 isoform X2 [Narcine bancroftii]|uniref:large ribosomal subunit protein mL39 isoform X2 n=1 Tax=Narcine bancroftii TaxID=1343680 RepID=UPI003831726C
MAASCVPRLSVRCSRFLSMSAASRLSNAELLQKRSKLFDQEKARQQALVPRIEKIEVRHVGVPEPGAVLIMNKGLSTPYNCAMHISNWCVRRSILALVDGEIWDMYKPLEKSCDIQFLTFTDENPEDVNQENFQSLTREAHQLIHKDLAFESLEVSPRVAAEIFEENKHKLTAIEEQTSCHPRKLVKLYRCGDFVDVSPGPHIPRTAVCSQYEITAAHLLGTSQPGLRRRFQGISLPLHLKTLFSVWGRLRQRSQKLVMADRNPTESKNQITECKEIGQTEQERSPGLL